MSTFYICKRYLLRVQRNDSMNKLSALNSIIFLTNRVGRGLALRVRRMAKLQEFGLSEHNIGILVDLWNKDGQTQQQLASSINKDKASVTRAIRVLEREGMVERRKASEDARLNVIFLTEKGRSFRQNLFPFAHQVVEAAIADIPPEELEICKSVLRRMYMNMIETPEQE